MSPASQIDNNSSLSVPVHLVQANHSQFDKLNSSKWNELKQDYLNEIDKISLSQSEQIIVLPEIITPALNVEDKVFMDKLSNLASSKNAHILFGSPIKDNNQYFNSIIHMTPDGLSAHRYDKLQLMPFGEYWPGRRILRHFNLEHLIPDTEYSAGTKSKPLKINESLTLSPSICLESIYPLFNPFESLGFLVILNNGWFFDSSAAYRHLSMSVYRAVEQGVPAIICANTGISAFINPNGSVIKKTSLEAKETLSEIVKFTNKNTVYERNPISLILLCGILVGIVFLNRLFNHNLVVKTFKDFF